MADPYVYPKTNCLINKAGIKEQKKLEDFENTIVNLSLIKLFKEDFIVKSVYDIFTIHKKIFEEVYDWAGEPRTINIIKQEVVLNGLSVVYCSHELIQRELNKLDIEFFKIAKPNQNKADFIKNISKAIASLWKIHPFREGNTRAVVTFLYFFVKNYKYDFDSVLLKKHAKYFRNSLVMASLGQYSENDHLEALLSDAISFRIKAKDNKRKDNSDVKYQEIKGVKMNEYQYNYHETDDK